MRVYTQPGVVDQYLPGRKNEKWDYINTRGRHFERDKFDEFKTRFYKLQGWDTSTGYPTRETLESLDLGYVADELEQSDRLGRGSKRPI
jgi:aldehyde:ferredoxin oxidoreductase